MGQEITLSKEQYGELDQFRPELFRRDMARVRSISDVAIRELRKEQRALAADIEAMELDPQTVEAMRLELRDRHHEVLSRIAHFRAVHVAKAVAYYNANIAPHGYMGGQALIAARQSAGTSSIVPDDRHSWKTHTELEQELGFSDSTIREWRAALRKANDDSDDPNKLHAEKYAEQLVNAWFKSTGLTEKKERQITGPPKERKIVGTLVAIADQIAALPDDEWGALMEDVVERATKTRFEKLVALIWTRRDEVREMHQNPFGRS